ncbi:complement C1q-like protein 3 [Littorina saxatilis]|uniref:C1q domain-containing protein n=1 Tax=Littorina saxatilis TaxID=31220 RepID=A0AAN9GC48_9CAEN
MGNSIPKTEMAYSKDEKSTPAKDKDVTEDAMSWDILHDAGDKALQEVIKQQSACIETLQTKMAAIETEMSQTKSAVQKLQKQVAFTAHFNEGGPIRISKSSPIAFSQVKLNLGNGYDPNSGVFTAPVSGLYLFHLHVKGDGLVTRQTTFLKIVKAESELAIVTLHNARHQYDHARASDSVATHVEAEQEVYVQYEDGAPSIDKWQDTSFTGVLICAD